MMNDLIDLIKLGNYKGAIESVNKNASSTSYWSVVSEQSLSSYHKIISDLELSSTDSSIPDLRLALATLYSKIGEHDKAIENYEAAILLKLDDSLVYYKLGDEYTYYIRDYAKGLINYEKAIASGSPNVWSHLGAAKCATEIGDIGLAEKHYRKGIDSDPRYPWSHYLFAKFLYESGRLEEARDEFVRAKEFNIDDNSILNYINDKIHSISEQIRNATYNSLVLAIDEILNLLKYSNGIIAHYTSTSTLKQIVFKNSSMRISEASYLNDPSEGELLWGYLNFPRTNPTTEKYQESLKEYEFSKKPFVLSFVRESRKNDLTLWRMYGKENGNEAAGCCIVYDQEKLLSNLSQAATETNRNTSEPSFSKHIREKCTIYQVAYIDADNQIVIPECDSEVTHKLSNRLSYIKDLLSEKKIDVPRVQQQIERISYLFKGREYSDEREVRLVMTPSWLIPVIDEMYDPPRVYLEIVNIIGCITEIILGPKSEKKNSLLASMAYFIDQTNHPIALKYSSLKFL